MNYSSNLVILNFKGVNVIILISIVVQKLNLISYY
jgi:hypothetical protein